MHGAVLTLKAGLKKDPDDKDMRVLFKKAKKITREMDAKAKENKEEDQAEQP